MAIIIVTIGYKRIKSRKLSVLVNISHPLKRYTSCILLSMPIVNQIEGRCSMIKGIGIDIIEISRVQDLLHRQRRLIDRILTDRERQKFEVLSERRQVEFLAGRFAAKEAYSK